MISFFERKKVDNIIGLQLETVVKIDVIRWLLDNSTVKSGRIAMNVLSGVTLDFTPNVVQKLVKYFRLHT